MYEDLTFCFDIDGTLCPIKKKEEAYIDLVPYPEMIDKIREYKAGGAKIVLFTSRNMNSYHGNIGLIMPIPQRCFWHGWKNGIFHTMRLFTENHGRVIRAFM